MVSASPAVRPSTATGYPRSSRVPDRVPSCLTRQPHWWIDTADAHVVVRRGEDYRQPGFQRLSEAPGRAVGPSARLRAGPLPALHAAERVPGLPLLPGAEHRQTAA